jgi:DNA helicase-2/ATP-dependent DNA helicase PcrA
MPREETSLLRIINTPPRGIGARTIETLMATALAQNTKIWDIMSRSAAALPTQAAAAVNQLVTLLNTCRSRLKSGQPLAQLARELIVAVGYEADIRRSYDDPHEQQQRWETVEEMVNALAEFEAQQPDASLSRFLDDMALAGRDFDNDKESKLRGNSVSLMTLHSAKGLEFPQVYRVGMEEGILPHQRSIEMDGSAVDEERRLCYVGITRAQELLTFSLALTRRKWGKPRETIASRFLYELTGQAERAPHRHPRPQTPAATQRRSGKTPRRK